MPVNTIVQERFEQDRIWERSWPKCFLVFSAIVLIILALVILATEIFNILIDFWHINVFGGIWTSVILFINSIFIFVTVCCYTTVRASTCSFAWNLLTLITLATLIVFDITFILNPSICILTPTCSTQSSSISINYIIQSIPSFSSYSIYNSKQFILEIQVGCAGLAFLICVVYFIIFFVCKSKLRKRTIRDNPVDIFRPQKRGLRIGQPPPPPSLPPPPPPPTKNHPNRIYYQAYP